MNGKFVGGILTVLVGMTLFLVSCGGGNVMSTPLGETDKNFIGSGKGADFASAKQDTYADLIKKAIIYVIGDSGYKNHQATIDKDCLNYFFARKYIYGDAQPNLADKPKKWETQPRDAEGNMVLSLNAWVNLVQLKSDLAAMGIGGQGGANANQGGYSAAVKDDPDMGGGASEDLGDVDMSSLTFLVYYNPNDPSINNDPENITYAKWAIDAINKELGNAYLQTFDVEAMEKLSAERNLLQEAKKGAIGVGLLLAEKVFAELYAEVTPSISYQGSKQTVLLKVKIFVRTTGALIATVEKGSEQYSENISAGIKVGLRTAATACMKDILNNLKNYVSKGRFYFIRLRNVFATKDAVSFASTMKNVEGVISCNIKSGSKDDGVYDFNVQFKGNPTDLMEKTLEFMSTKSGFETLDIDEIRGNEITFSLMTSFKKGK